MKAKISFEVDNCTKCPFHERHSIVTADSFEHEMGIYCSLTEDESDSWWHYTYDDRITKKLVAADDWRPEKYANVPSWCPFIMKQYKALLANTYYSEEWWQGDDEAWLLIDKPIIDAMIRCAADIMDQLSKCYFKQVVFRDVQDSLEHSQALATVTILSSFMLNYQHFLEDYGLPEEDRAFVETMAYSGRYSKLEFKRIKRQLKKSPHNKLMLDPYTALKVAIFLAEDLVILNLMFENIKEVHFNFTYEQPEDLSMTCWPRPTNLAELRIVTKDNFEMNNLNGGPRILIGRLRSTTMSLLGLKFKFFINDEEINIRDFFN
ncbi:hypothetical protein IKF23_02305 [Candidatus Saccharibacteria bacterium]|nr:hypothetical protein [Candidatus Saccharibacteria bacterium]